MEGKRKVSLLFSSAGGWFENDDLSGTGSPLGSGTKGERESQFSALGAADILVEAPINFYLVRQKACRTKISALLDYFFTRRKKRHLAPLDIRLADVISPPFV